jgi:hypothetical protein
MPVGDRRELIRPRQPAPLAVIVGKIRVAIEEEQVGIQQLRRRDPAATRTASSK